MSAVAFNTLNFTRRLRAAGVPAEQAEAFADALSEDAMVEVATKRDLAAMEDRLTGQSALLKRDITELEARMGARSVQLENRLVIRLGGIMAVVAGLLFAALKLA